ncbi:MAG: hypothetical protein KDI44_12065 [Thiothrix sp.]|nr:hypothetical protein [Thiothrix sp.]
MLRAVWLHADLRRGDLCASLHPLRREPYLQRFAHEAPVLQRQVLGLIREYHAHQFPVIWYEELIQASWVAPLVLYGLGGVETARHFLLRLARSYQFKPNTV